MESIAGRRSTSGCYGLDLGRLDDLQRNSGAPVGPVQGSEAAGRCCREPGGVTRVQSGPSRGCCKGLAWDGTGTRVAIDVESGMAGPMSGSKTEYAKLEWAEVSVSQIEGGCARVQEVEEPGARAADL